MHLQADSTIYIIPGPLSCACTLSPADVHVDQSSCVAHLAPVCIDPSPTKNNLLFNLRRFSPPMSMSMLFDVARTA